MSDSIVLLRDRFPGLVGSLERVVQSLAASHFQELEDLLERCERFFEPAWSRDRVLRIRAERKLRQAAEQEERFGTITQDEVSVAPIVVPQEVEMVFAGLMQIAGEVKPEIPRQRACSYVRQIRAEYISLLSCIATTEAVIGSLVIL